VPLAGDRAFGDDPALVGGFARIDGRRVMLIGHEKGDDTASRLKHNFGMAKPEGYRKAIRLMRLADQFGIPVVTLVDTPGAFPGVEAEERGQAEAIARSTEQCLSLKVPMIAVIVGEGGLRRRGGNRRGQPCADGSSMRSIRSFHPKAVPRSCGAPGIRPPMRREAMKITASDLHGLGCDRSHHSGAARRRSARP